MSAVAVRKPQARSARGGCPEPWRAARPLPVKAVGTFVPKLTRAAFEKYGFSAATLVTDWAAVAGSELAAFTVPERLKWPRAGGDYGEGGAEAAGRPGATLILRVDPARALEVQYGASRIVERVNGYFGYCAVAEIRLVQGPVAPPEAIPGTRRSTPPASVPSVAGPPLPDIRHAALRAALAKMQASIAGRQPA